MTRTVSKIVVVFALGTIALAPLAARADEIAPGGGAQAALRSALSNTQYPLAVKLKDLDASWRRFVLSDASDGGATAMQMMMLGARAGLDFDVHFTKGQIAKIGDNSYLIAYQLPAQIDARFLNWHGHGPAPRPRKPDSETVLNLSLLNVKNIGSMNDVRPFDAKTDMIDQKQANADSVRTLEQLGQGLLRFIRARGTFPELENPIEWEDKRFFYPYIGDERLFMHPATQEIYLYNDVLGGVKAAHIPNKQSFVVFYEAEPSADGTRGVLFMDGHVERLSPAHWQTVRKASKIENDGNGANAAPDTVVVVPRPAG